MKPESRIFVAGGHTPAGKSILKYLRLRGFHQTACDLNSSVDLSSSADVAAFFHKFQPEYIFFVGTSSAGIAANQKYPADLCADNLLAATHVLTQASKSRIKKILYLASSCIYPKQTPQPMTPDLLMTGALESTSEAYAAAKLAGLALAKACRVQHQMNVISAIAADVYGPEDSFDPENSHVADSLLRKTHEAKISAEPFVTIWGSGRPVRDFIFSEDLADACLFLMRNYEGDEPINISAGHYLSITDLAAELKTIVQFDGAFRCDLSKPDGTLIKTLDPEPLFKLGWQPRFTPYEGLRRTYQEFLKQNTVVNLGNL